ncbi:MAG: cell division protein ZapA [Bacillota bacterium]|nr:cell division protein ZapA [Bacillota bacterium]REJ37044.1 MAG: cell division protein ZapA [Bacillota bacterium]
MSAANRSAAVKHRVQVRIGDEDFVLRSEAPPEYMQKVAAVVDAKFSELQAIYRHVPRHRVAILTALHLADELERLRAENQELLALLKEAR